MFKRFTAGVAVGYVMGARAGDKRYDQITEFAERALEVPFVERLADTARSVTMVQGRRALEGFKGRAARWSNSDEAVDEDEDEPVEDEDEPVDEDEDEPVDEDDDEPVEDDEDEPVEDDDEPVEDEDEPQRKSGHRKPTRSGPRHRVSSLASAARERGRAD